MAEAFFAPNWYRVAGLRPRLAAHVTVERHWYGAQAWYVLLDRLSGRVHRMTPASFLFATRLDGRRTVDDVWQQTVLELDDEAPGQQAVVQMLMQLHGADLLTGDIPPDAAELLTRRDRMGRQVLTRNLRSPMSLQVPLVDPDRFLTATLGLVRPVLGPWGAVLWLVLVAAGMVVAAQHWEELANNAADRLIGAEGLLSLALCYPVLKVLHELGHGWMAKRFGCEVREMGVMLLVLVPIPYVDASASAALASKWQRAAVAFAGIAVELGLAAAAALVWAQAEPGLLRAVAFNVMLIGSVSTLVVNGNPLLRFDGYYVLSDLVEVPNLAQRGGQFWGYLANRFVLGVPDLQASRASAWERLVFALYHPAALAYRVSVSVGIALYVAGHYLVVGVVLAAVMLGTSIAWPVLRGLWRVTASPLYARCRRRAVLAVFGGMGLAAMLLLLVPAPLHSVGEGVVWLPQDAIVRAGTDGFVQRVAAPGAVEPGTVLVAMDDPLGAARLEVEVARTAELRARRDAEWVTDRIAAAVTGFELTQQEAVLAREQGRQDRLAVRAGSPGRFSPVRPTGDLDGRYVKEGEMLGYVVPDAGEVVRVLVPQGDIDLVRGRLVAVSILLPDARTTLRSVILRAVPGGDSELPSEAMASSNGGSVVTDPRDGKVLRALERHFQFDVALPPLPPGADQVGLGSKVLVRFDYAWEPVAAMLYRRVRQGLLGRFET